MSNPTGAPLRYAPMIQALHWGIALLAIAQLGMGKFLEVEPGEEGGYFLLHASLGVLVLVLMLVRVGWRATHAVPVPPPGTTKGQALFAAALVVGFYVLLFVLPMSGWALASAEGEAVSFFGIFDLPALPVGGEDTEDLVEEVHELAGNALLVLLALHVAAALKHHFIAKNDVLMRMLPRH